MRATFENKKQKKTGHSVRAGLKKKKGGEVILAVHPRGPSPFLESVRGPCSPLGVRVRARIRIWVSD